MRAEGANASEGPKRSGAREHAAAEGEVPDGPELSSER
jgi:hypothetical protein